MDGAVTICATTIATAAIPALASPVLVLFALLLGGLGVLGAKKHRASSYLPQS
jgi:hypothetical protein